MTFAFTSSFLPSGRLLTQFHPTTATNRTRLPSIVRPFATADATADASADATANTAANTTRRIPGVARPVVPSPPLRDVVQDKAQSRSAVLRDISAYVKANNLQDPNNKRVVICDEKLKQLFNVDSFKFIQMSKHVSPLLEKPETFGGRYIEEARCYEEQYLIEQAKKLELQQKSNQVPKKRKRTRRTTTGDSKPRSSALFKPVLLSPELSAICRNRTEMPRSDVLKAVWDYIHMNNLHHGPGQPIKCDFLLEKVFKVDTIESRGIMKGISRHMTKKE